MTALRHTPGPWLSTSTGEVMRGYSQPFAISQSGQPNLVAGVFGDVEGGEEVAKANARLITAAPDLLEALADALKYAEFEGHAFRPWHDKARAAIAKARGENAEVAA